MARKKYRSKRKLYEKKVKLIDSRGIEYRKSIYAKSQDELKAKEIKLIEDNKRGLCLNDDVTVGQYAEQWLKTIDGKRSDNTFIFYKYSVQHIQDALGTIRLDRLKKTDIQNAVDSLMDQPRTAQIFKMTLSQICESAIDDNHMIKNPCRKVVLPSYKAKEKRALTQIELDAIRTADLDEKERLFVSLLLYCGLRRGEALALSRADIDLEQDILTVNHNLAFPENQGYLKEPKTKKSHRSVPIPKELHDQLMTYKYDLYLFTKQNGDLFSRTAYLKFWDRIIRKLNEAAGSGSIDRIQNLTAHVFRHNYVTRLREQGTDMWKVQNLCGHSSERVTSGIYDHSSNIDDATRQSIENAFKLHLA